MKQRAKNENTGSVPAYVADLARAWMRTLNEIPTAVIDRLDRFVSPVEECTPVRIGERVYVNEGVYFDSYGYVAGREDADTIVIRTDSGEQRTIPEAFLQTDEMHNYLPTNGTMWTFKDPKDIEWCEQRPEDLSDCWLRIYQSRDLGFVLGTDMLTDLDEEIWIPLFVKRIQWLNAKENENEQGAAHREPHQGPERS